MEDRKMDFVLCCDNKRYQLLQAGLKKQANKLTDQLSEFI